MDFASAKLRKIFDICKKKVGNALNLGEIDEKCADFLSIYRITEIESPDKRQNIMKVKLDAADLGDIQLLGPIRKAEAEIISPDK